MSDPYTVRILSIDGGGMRGYLPNLWMAQFCQTAGIPQADLWKYFDVIAGTSVGGILALSYAYGLTPDELSPFFTEKGPWIFTIRTAADVLAGSINSSLPSNRPNVIQKIAILSDADQFYKSVNPASNYGSSRLKAELTDVFGTDTMQALKTTSLITSYKQNTTSPTLFSNATYPRLSGQNESIVNVAMATSAAPLYLPPYSIGANPYVDGAVFLNNPARRALTLGKTLKPQANRFCVLSLGTGIGEIGFDEDVLTAMVGTPFEDTVKTLVALYDSSMTGGQEAISEDLLSESQGTLSNTYYYRMQTVLDPNINTELDNSDPSFLSYIEETKTDIFNEDIINITNFIGHFLA